MKFTLLFFAVLLNLSLTIRAQIRIIDFDNAVFKNGTLTEKISNWKTIESRLSPKEIDGTPSMVLNFKTQQPFASAESNPIAGGCKYLSLDFKRLDGFNCDVDVWVNDRIVTTIDQTNGKTQSLIKLPVFIAGPVKFKFKQRGEKSGSIAIDNILWTPCSEDEAVVFNKEHEAVKPTGNLIFNGDFETGKLDNFTMAGNHKNRIVTTPVRAGKYALRSVIDRYEDDVNFRCGSSAKYSTKLHVSRNRKRILVWL